LHGCQEGRAAEEVNENVASIRIEVDVLHEQADELALLLLSACIEDLTEGLPARLHNAWVDSCEPVVGLGLPSTLQKLLFQTPIVKMFIYASETYHDKFWYPRNGVPVVQKWKRESPWGKLFEEYPEESGDDDPSCRVEPFE